MVMVVVVVVRQMDVRVDDRPAIISRRLFGRAWVEGREGEEVAGSCSGCQGQCVRRSSEVLVRDSWRPGGVRGRLLRWRNTS